MNTFMKKQLQLEFMIHVLDLITDKTKIDDAIVSRAAMRPKGTTLSQHDCFDENGELDNPVNENAFDSSRVSIITLAKHHAITTALSSRERLIFDAILWDAQARVMNDHLDLTAANKGNDIQNDDDLAEFAVNKSFIQNLSKLCGPVLNEHFNTGFKSVGNFKVSEELVLALGEKIVEFRKDVNLARTEEIIDKLMTCFTKKKWKNAFINSVEGKSTSDKNSPRFFETQTTKAKLNAFVELACLLKSFQSDGSYNEIMLREKLNSLIDVCRGRSRNKKSETADKIRSLFSDVLVGELPALSMRNSGKKISSD